MTDQSGAPHECVAVFDLDGTITRVDIYVHFLLGVMRRHPLRALRAFWLPLALAIHKLGWKDNTWLKRIFLGVIAGGLRRDNLDAIVQPVVNELVRHHIRPGATVALRRHRAAGHRVILATAGFDFYVASLARHLDVDEFVCTSSAWFGDRLVAEMPSGNCYGQEKLSRLMALLGQNQDRRPYVYAYTDHYSDRFMLDWADEAVAVNPDSRLREYCGRRGYLVVDWELKRGPYATTR